MTRKGNRAPPIDDVVTVAEPDPVPIAPQVIEGIVLKAGRDEPYVLPSAGILAFILGNKLVYRRVVVLMVVSALLVLAVVVAAGVTGVRVNAVMTVAGTGAATVLGVAVTAVVGRRNGPKPPSTPGATADEGSPS
jgi:hypothetical protein